MIIQWNRNPSCLLHRVVASAMFLVAFRMYRTRAILSQLRLAWVWDPERRNFSVRLGKDGAVSADPCHL